MSPSHTMSAHWGKQIYTSWRQSRQGGAQQQPATSPLPSPGVSSSQNLHGGYFGEKRSMDSDRSSSGAPSNNNNNNGSSSSSSSSSSSAGASLTRLSSATSTWFGRR